MVGCADVIRSYPTDDCAWIGLLLFSGAHQSRGYGKTALALINAIAREWGCRQDRGSASDAKPSSYALVARQVSNNANKSAARVAV
ncbi:GNAT family N-acetyltransferase [Paraburkholderia dilworthii]|uniref:GNAT family N-acetyltransferase n=1 Tax=Paraburkholderia dilworthii TaxID=948106 RepID=UPI003898F3EB